MRRVSGDRTGVTKESFNSRAVYSLAPPRSALICAAASLPPGSCQKYLILIPPVLYALGCGWQITRGHADDMSRVQDFAPERASDARLTDSAGSVVTWRWCSAFCLALRNTAASAISGEAHRMNRVQRGRAGSAGPCASTRSVSQTERNSSTVDAWR